MDIFSPQTWNGYDSGGLIEQRLELIRKIIPSDVSSILDAGCGNGVITNALHPNYDVTGLDLSDAALEYVQAPKVKASVTSIPFPDKAFDLVMCNEVLEHLDDNDLSKAISELSRCAARYCLISVPNQEQLAAGLIKCRGCGNEFHVYGHLQSFSLSRLDSLLGWKRIWSQSTGPAMRTYSPALLKFRQCSLKQWFNPDVPISCPACGSGEFWTRRSLLTKAVNAVGRIGRASRPYWLMVLYEAPANGVTNPGLDHESG